MMQDAYIIAGSRSAVGKATKGTLRDVRPDDLAALVIREAFTRRTAVAGVLGVVGVGLLVLGPDAALDPVGVTAALGGAVA